MFGQDEHSKALMAQWQKSKVLRDPDALAKLAQSKGLKMSDAPGLDAVRYKITSGERILSQGSLETVATFLDSYTAVSLVA